MGKTVAALTLGLCVLASNTRATPTTIAATGSHNDIDPADGVTRTASAVFAVKSGNLTITLTSAGGAAKTPTDVWLDFFINISATLTQTSATAGSGGTILNPDSTETMGFRNFIVTIK